MIVVIVYYNLASKVQIEIESCKAKIAQKHQFTHFKQKITHFKHQFAHFKHRQPPMKWQKQGRAQRCLTLLRLYDHMFICSLFLWRKNHVETLFDML